MKLSCSVVVLCQLMRSVCVLCVRPKHYVHDLSTQLRGGEYELEKSARKDLADLKDDEDIYVSLQFEPLRALFEVTRRVGRVLGMALRRLSRAFTGSSNVRRKRGAKRLRASSSEGSGEDSISTKGTKRGALTPASIAQISRLARRRGLAVAILASRDPNVLDTALRVVSSEKSLMVWETDLTNALDWVSMNLGGQRRTSAAALVVIAFPVSEDEDHPPSSGKRSSRRLRILSVRTATDKTLRTLFTDDSFRSWMSRCFETHTTEFSQLEHIRNETALRLEQQTERRLALEQEHAADIEAEIAAQAEEKRLAQEAEAERQAEIVAERRKLAAENLPPEPPATNKDVVTIALRDPSGKRHARRFALIDATTARLADWVDAILLIDLRSQFRLRLAPNGPDINNIMTLDPPLNLLELDTTTSSKKRLLFECLPITADGLSKEDTK